MKFCPDTRTLKRIPPDWFQFCLIVVLVLFKAAAVSQKPKLKHLVEAQVLWKDRVFFPDQIELTPKDLRWVGAWWLGFLVASCLLFITALPYLFFPREMEKEVSLMVYCEYSVRVFTVGTSGVLMVKHHRSQRFCPKVTTTQFCPISGFVCPCHCQFLTSASSWRALSDLGSVYYACPQDG